MTTQELFKEGKYTIHKHDGIPTEAMEFLDSIAWGNEGAIYEHKNTEEHIKLIKKPSLVGIYEEDEIRATAVFSNTSVTANTNKFNCHYIRYFASSTKIRGKGVMKKFSKKVMELIREKEEEKTVYFACIEKGNRSSYKVVESAGYSDIGTIKTIGFSRFFPRKNKSIQQVTTKKEQQEVITLLKDQYKEHSLVQFDSVFLNDNYYVIRVNGEIVAGCQYHRAHWVINQMKGFSGKIVMNVVPVLPILNKIFNPNKFEFLAFEGIYVKEGYEDQLQELFEGLLAKENLKSSMLWLGKTCPVRKRITENGKLGMIHAFLKDSDIQILASFQNLDSDEISDLKSNPLYASAFDYI